MEPIEIATLARFAANSADQIAAAELVLDVFDLTAAEQALWTQIADNHLWALDEIRRLVSDADLLAAYQRIDEKPDNSDADVLLAEIERRGLIIS